MTEDMFEMPDMDDLTRQMEEAMQQAQKAMDDLPGQLEGLEDVMGSLSGLMGDLPDQLGGLEEAISGFADQHQENMESLVGEPDWSVTTLIRVGDSLELKVDAVFDLAKAIQTWQSTQGGDLEGLVSGVMQEQTGEEPGEALLGQVVGQLQKGRGMAKVQALEVLKCSFSGAPANAAESLQLSPEANIPLVVQESGIGFEFAPMLTIKNKWENAALPSFEPMGEQVVVPLDRFEDEEPFSTAFAPSGQETDLEIRMKFAPLD
ncbi:MAG: hypothetical protein JXA25_17760 [Anaerolineales bacterium]|nr:hypothetical protein [Anaerolineales bacterium]